MTLKAVATPSINTILPGDAYVPSPGTDVQIQAAMDAVYAMHKDTNNSVGTVYLAPGGTYTLTAGLIMQIESVSLEGNGSILNAAGIPTNATALTITNTTGFPTNGSFLVWGGEVKNLHISGDGTASGSNYNTTRGIHIEGTPDLNSYTLNGTINAAATTVIFSSSTSLPTTAFSIKIDSEYILIAAGSGTSRTVATNGRGYLGSTAAGHTSGATILTWHQANPQLRNVYVEFFNKGISIGDSSFCSDFEDICAFENYYAIYANAATSTAQAEQIRFRSCNISNNTVGIYAASQILRFYGTSLDYNNREFDMEGGTGLEFYGCHFEWNYGQTAGQTNSPFYMTGSDNFFVMEGGRMIYTGSGLPFYPSHGYVDNASSVVRMRDVGMANIGKFSTTTSDDVFWTNADSTHHFTGNVATIDTSGTYSLQFTTNDLPSAITYVQGGQWLRNGTGDPYTELANRITLTGTCAIATQAGTDGTVTPKSGSQMLKITGAGTVIITFPQFKQPMIKNAWSFFMNGAEIGGTVTIAERQITVHPVWNGSTSLTFVEDSRTNVTGTYTLPSAGVNQWTRVAWKSVTSSPVPSPRMFDYWAIIIDTSAMTGTNLYLDVMSLMQL